jgi:hypothetical protein
VLAGQAVLETTAALFAWEWQYYRRCHVVIAGGIHQSEALADDHHEET